MTNQAGQTGPVNPYYDPPDQEDTTLNPPPRYFGSVPESLPPGMRMYTAAELLQGLPQQQGYTSISTDWGRAMMRQFNAPNMSYFTQDPKRLAKFYNFLQTAPKDWRPPEWLDPAKIAEAYQFMSGYTGKGWQSWEPLDQDDPANIYLTTLQDPPKKFWLPNEIDRPEALLENIYGPPTMPQPSDAGFSNR